MPNPKDSDKQKKEEAPFVVKVHIKRARNLIVQDRFSNSSDPFCIAIVGAEKKKTKVIEKNLAPEWDEKFEWFCFKRPEIVDFQVQDWNRLGGSDPMGTCSLPLVPLWDGQSTHSGWIKLLSVDQGEIEVTVDVQVQTKVGERLVKIMPKFVANNYFGIPGYFFFFGGVGLLSLMMLMMLGQALLCNLIGFLYPLYASFKALKTDESDDDTQWLMYWVVFGFFVMLESTVWNVVSWLPFYIPELPFYHILKLALLIISFLPQTRGAEKLYTNILRPVFDRYERDIDDQVLKLKHYANDLLLDFGGAWVKKLL